MLDQVSEASYPITFREEISRILGEKLRNLHSVVLVGMRRVGISNFLRFFTNHPDIIKKYVDKKQKHLFITVDLNDLIERELYPFWVLTLKRIADSSEDNLDPQVNSQIQAIFLDAVQTQDQFLIIDAIKKALLKILEAGYLPTIFFNRFDRIQNAITVEFIANLESLKDASRHKLSYVFTSFRKLEDLAKVFEKASLYLVSDVVYLPLAEKKDLEVIYKNFNTRSHLELTQNTKDALLDLVGGYIQYLYLSMIALEQVKGAKNLAGKELLPMLTVDEAIKLQSEELWESLNEDEQQILRKFLSQQALSIEDKEKGKYLLSTGMIKETNSGGEIFSPIFQSYLREKLQNLAESQSNNDLSKKELALFTFLKQNINQVCERELIITTVWPQEEELGVSDWAIDRLVSRLRSKLKLQNSRYEVTTIKTRGFKLVSA